MVQGAGMSLVGKLALSSMEYIQTKIPDGIVHTTIGLKIKQRKMVNADHFYLSIHSAHYQNEASQGFPNVKFLQL